MKESQLAVKETNADSGEIIYRKLPYYTEFLKHFNGIFQEAVTIDEIVAYFENIDETNIGEFRIMVLDLVTKYLLFGLLEFAGEN